MKQLKKIYKFANKFAKTSKFEYLVLFVILVGAFGVRLYKINNPLDDWHAWRQSDTATVSRIYLDNGIDLLNPRYYDISPTQTGVYNPQGLRFVEFPIFNLLNVIAFKAVPRFSLEVWGRLLSVFSAVGSSFFLYLIGKKFLGKWGGILSAFFYAFLPYNIYFTRVILPEPMTVFFTVASLWFFIVYLDKQSKTYLLLTAILFSLAMLLKPFIAFYFPVYIFLLVKKWGWKVLWRRVDIYVALLIALAPVFIWRIWMNERPYGIPASNWLFNDDGIRFKMAFWRWIFGERLGYLILGIWGVPLFIFGVLKKQNWPILMTALGMFLYVSVVATGNVRHDYYQTLTIPAVVLMLSSGAIYLWNSENFNKWIARPTLAFCVVMMFGIGWYQIKGDYQVNHYEIIVAGAEVDKITPKDSIVIAPYNGDTTFLYQTHRFGWPVVDRSFDELIKLGADYFVSVNYDNDTNNLLKKYKAIEQNSSFVIIDLHQPIQGNQTKK